MAPEEIVLSLEAFVLDHDRRQRAIAACDEAYDRELSAAVFSARFAELIGVAEETLLALPGACQGRVHQRG